VTIDAGPDIRANDEIGVCRVHPFIYILGAERGGLACLLRYPGIVMALWALEAMASSCLERMSCEYTWPNLVCLDVRNGYTYLPVLHCLSAVST
jgi:hypothetical protein